MSTVSTAEKDAILRNGTIGKLPQRLLRGLFLQEWLAHGKVLSWALSIWLICLWVLEMFSHPVWIITFGAVYALLIGLKLGGSDAINETEEFHLALPPVRGRRYMVRLAIGLLPLMFYVIVGLLAIGCNLPQKLWGLLVESGMTEPFAISSMQDKSIYAMYAVSPLILFALTFSFSTTAGRGWAFFSWIISLFTTYGMFMAGSLLGDLVRWKIYARYPLTEGIDWIYFISLLGPAVCLAAVSLIIGYYLYKRKEAACSPSLRHYSAWIALGGLIVGFLVIVNFYHDQMLRILMQR